MSVSAPQRPPRSSDPPDRAELEALIEEARRRARRRRRRYLAAALLLGAGIGSAAVIFGGGGGPAALTSHAGPPDSPGRAQAALRPLGVRNGPLTVADGNGMFSINSRGARHDLFRCQESPGDRFCTIMESIAWSPRGDELLFSSTTISIPSRYNGMHVLDLRTGKTRRAGAEGFSPDWSRDSRIALVQPTFPATFPSLVGSIFIRRIDGGTAREAALATGTEGYDSSPSWSPDGKRLVFATRQKGESTISIIDSDGSRRRLLAAHASAPAWSPDGSLIAYRTSCGVKLITPQGTDATPRVPGVCGLGVRGAPHWSPDGRSVAIATRNGIYLMHRDGTRRTYMPLRGFAGPTFSPNFGPVAQISWQPIAK